MDIDLKHRITEILKQERKRGVYTQRYNVEINSVKALMYVCHEYHTRELSRLSIKDTIKILIRKIVNKFKNK